MYRAHAQMGNNDTGEPRFAVQNCPTVAGALEAIGVWLDENLDQHREVGFDLHVRIENDIKEA